MAHDATDLRVRTKKFALQIIRLYQNLPHFGEAQVIGKQILRSGTSVGAQYREACRGKSPADFVNMMGGSLKELDETAYWLELLTEGEIVPVTKLADLRLSRFERDEAMKPSFFAANSRGFSRKFKKFVRIREIRG